VCDWDPFGICLSAKKPVALHYWYGTWRRERAAKRTYHKPVTMVTTRAGRLAAGMVPPGGLVKQKCPSLLRFY